MLRMKSFITAAACAALLRRRRRRQLRLPVRSPGTRSHAGPAHAANSICVFSGQNDDPAAPITSAEPTADAPNGPGGRRRTTART